MRFTQPNGSFVYRNKSRVARAAVSDTAYNVAGWETIVAFTSITSNRQVTLPNPSLMAVGWYLYVKDESGSCANSKRIQIRPFASELIDGASGVDLVTGYARAMLYTNGTHWYLQAV